MRAGFVRPTCLVCVALCAAFLFSSFANRASLATQQGRQLKRDQATTQEKRIALVIGNGEYQFAGRLPNPATDAAEVSKALREVGFDVFVGTDCTKEKMERLIDDFGAKLAQGGEHAVGVFYYAGHGVQIKGTNYLVPVDARAQSESDVRYRAVDVDFLLGKMDDAKSGVNIIILDACRDNPFSRSFRNSSNGLAQVTAPRGTLIAYATSPGKVATDSGVYRSSLIAALRTPGLNVLDVFQEVGAKVDRETKGQQTPWQSSSLTGRFFFVPSVEQASVPKPSQPDSKKAGDPAAAEQEAWEEVRNSTDVEDFREFLKNFPNGTYAGTAKVKLRKREAAVKPSPSTPTGSDTSSLPPTSSNPTAPSPGTQVEGPAGIKFVFIQAGQFQMGSENGGLDEQQVHRVVITAPIWMGKYEVTQAEWEAVMGSNPSYFKGRDLPIEKVSWDDCQEFIRKLNAKGDGYTYRLPTEAEWEYACRAGSTGDYAGNLDAMGWYDKNSGGKTHQVGQKQANAWGLYDMHGNVWEWCQDWYGPYPGNSVTNPSGPTTGSARVYRGGSWLIPAAECRSGDRNAAMPGHGNPTLGFRLVRARK